MKVSFRYYFSGKRGVKIEGYDRDVVPKWVTKLTAEADVEMKGYQDWIADGMRHLPDLQFTKHGYVGVLTDKRGQMFHFNIETDGSLSGDDKGLIGFRGKAHYNGAQLSQEINACMEAQAMLRVLDRKGHTGVAVRNDVAHLLSVEAEINGQKEA